MTTETKAYPVTLRGDLSIPPGRWVWLFKWLLLVPHFIVLGFLFIAAAFCWIISLFAILFTGEYPKWAFDFVLGYMRWWWRVGFYSYAALGTDKYPPFSLEPDPNYPADLEVVYPEKLSQGLVLVKWWLLVIPQAIITSLFTGNDKYPGLIPVLAVFSGIYMLFTGKKYPEDLFKFIMALNKWSYNVSAYEALMTDKYPPFKLEM
jgi:hypothetical protein